MDKIFRIDLDRGTMVYEFYKFVGKTKRARKQIGVISVPLPKKSDYYAKNY